MDEITIVDQKGVDLGGAMVKAMQEWGATNGELDGRGVMVALTFAVTRTLDRLPAHRRHVYAEELCREIMSKIKRSAS